MFPVRQVAAAYEPGICRETGICACARKRVLGRASAVMESSSISLLTLTPRCWARICRRHVRSSICSPRPCSSVHIEMCRLGETFDWPTKVVGLACQTKRDRLEAVVEQVEMQWGTCPVPKHSILARKGLSAERGAAMSDTTLKARCSRTWLSTITRPSLRRWKSRAGTCLDSCGLSARVAAMSTWSRTSSDV